MELKGISIIVILSLCLFKLGDAQITKWTTPADVTDATGTSSTENKIKEDVAVGSTVITLEAVASTGDTITKYELVSGDTTKFELVDSTTTGELKTKAALDFETTKSYEFKVRATDSKDPANTGDVTFTVTIEDVNEAAPKFPTIGTVCVEDKSAAGTEVTEFKATDADTANTIEYTIASGTGKDDFKIAATKLQVNTDKTLDIATTAKYELVIQATDDGSTAKSSTVTYTIEVKSECNGGSALTVTIATLLVALVACF